MPSRVELPSLSFIVARSHPGHVIGRDNRLPWHLRSDLVRFKSITLGHVMIMGRKTYDSIGRTLPGRTTVVVTRTPAENVWHDQQETSLLWAGDRRDALHLADLVSIARDANEFFVIGGAEIFSMFADLCDKVYLTEALAEVAGDTRFDVDFTPPAWRLAHVEDLPQSKTDQYPSRFSIYEKGQKTIRHARVPDSLADSTARRQWVKQNLAKLVVKKPGQVRAPDDLSLIPEESA